MEIENKKYKYHQKKEQIPKGCWIFVSGGVVPRWCQSKECDRFPDSTTTQRDHRTSRILERAEQIQIQIQTYLQSSLSHKTLQWTNPDDDLDVSFVEDDHDEKMRRGGCNYLVNRAECSGSDIHTADLSTGSVFYIR